jgi:hypothetical protein
MNDEEDTYLQQAKNKGCIAGGLEVLAQANC